MDLRYPNSFRVADIGDVHFSILVDARDGGQVPDWEMRSNIQSYTVPGSNPPIVVNDLVNHEASTVTWRLLMASRADYRKLLTMRGQVGRLYVLKGLQSHISPGVTFDGQAYDYLDDTTLLDVAQTGREVDGHYETTVTFQRVEDTASYTVQPAMMLNFADVGTANPLVNPPVLRTPDDTYDVDMFGDVRPGSGRYGSRAVRLLRDDSAYLSTSNHQLTDSTGVIAVRCRWQSEVALTTDMIRLGNVSTNGIRIWRSSGEIGVRIGGLTNIVSGHDTAVAINDWTDIILFWGLGLYLLWIDGERIVTGSLGGNPGVTGNQLIVGSNAEASRGDIHVDAVMTYSNMSDEIAAMLHRSWAWDWGSVVTG